MCGALQKSSPNFQTLAPKPVAAAPATPEEEVHKRRRKNTSVACLSCKARRIKCDGAQPCSTCARSQGECVYRVENDQRRQIRTRLATFEKHSDVLHHLFDQIKNRNDSNIDDLVELVKKSASVEDLEARIAESDLRTPIEGLQHVDDVPCKVDVRAETSSSLPKQDGSILERLETPHKDLVMRAVDISHDWHFSLRAKPGALANHTQAKLSSVGRSTARSVSPRGYFSNADAIQANWYPALIQQQQLHIFERPEWAIPPLAFDDGSPLSRVYLSFMSGSKEAIRNDSASTQRILGGTRPCVNRFFRAGRPDDPHDVSTWACGVAASFGEMEQPIRLMSILFMHKLMQWMIVPSAESYAALYEAQRPTLAQRLLPHPAAIDMVCEPEIRTALCKYPRDFITPAKDNSVNWPGTIEDAVESDPDTDQLLVRKVFEDHVVSKDIISYCKPFLVAFPDVDLRCQM